MIPRSRRTALNPRLRLGRTVARRRAGAKAQAKPEYTGRCYRCNAWLRYGELHACAPSAVRYCQAVQAARELIRPAPEVPYPFPPSPVIDFDGLVEPAPPQIEYLPSAPRLRVSADEEKEKAPLVTLLPTLLLRDTAAQREGEPSTVTPRTYQGSDRIGPLRVRCRCTEIARRGMGGCTPAAEATRLHSLPWTYSVNLTAPSDAEFWERFRYFERTALMALVSLSTGLLTDPAYIISVVSPTPIRSRSRRTGFHAHLLLANVDWTELRSLLTAWGDVPPNAIIRVDRLPSTPWKALHYTLSNDPRTGVPEIDTLPNNRHLPLRHLVDLGRGMGHCDGSPAYSPNLEDVLARWWQIRSSGLSPSRYGEGRRNQPSRSREARRKERERNRLRLRNLNRSTEPRRTQP